MRVSATKSADALLPMKRAITQGSSEIGYRFPRAAALHKAGAAVLLVIAVGVNAIDNGDKIVFLH